MGKGGINSGGAELPLFQMQPETARAVFQEGESRGGKDVRHEPEKKLSALNIFIVCSSQFP